MEKFEQNILKTGTSTVGIVCKDGVVMAGDRKATLGGQIVASKNAAKVHKINDYIIMSITGNASDAQMALRIIAAQLKLKELRDKKRPTIKESASFISSYYYQAIRQPAVIPAVVGSLVAGFNEDETTELYSVMPDGSIERIKDYDANVSSGMPYILGLLERQYKKDLSIEEATKLAIECIKSSSERDTASGYGVDVFTITKQGINHVVKQKSEAVYSERD